MPQSQNDNVNENLANTAFISEKIKQRPVNKKKLFRRTVITVSLAVIFGVVACLTSLLLQPIFSDRLYPEKEPEMITFPEESISKELTPEEMYADDNEIAASEAQSIEATQLNQIEQAIESYVFDSHDYSNMMSSLRLVASEASRSIVRVTAISSDTNWFSSSFESSGSTSGIIVADNGYKLYILTSYAAIQDAETIQVTFCDNTSNQAQLNMADDVTGLCVITVRKATVYKETLENIAIATLGSSNSNNFTGLPVIAIGDPIGVQGSISYGIITSEKSTIDMVDSVYKLLTTDIQGSPSGSGVLVNLKGHVVGIIDMSHQPSDLNDIICAIGITELKPLIEDLSNLTPRASLGIHGTTVPQTLQALQHVPAGAYIIKTEMNSPAMKAGIQSGDIITSIGDSQVVTYEMLLNTLALFSPDDIITVTVMRQAPNDYIEMDLEVTLSGSTHN